MIHFTYKITDTISGKYYVGRHSTENLHDGYMGSGKWIRSLKSKDNLIKEILNFYDNFDSLIEAEENLIKENYGNLLNMNFNNSSIGFATGKLNPANTEKEKQRRKSWNWMKTEEGKKFARENNPSKLESVKEQRKEQSILQLKMGDHNFQNPITKAKMVESSTKRLKFNNPMKDPIIKAKVSEALRGKQQTKVVCPNCNKSGGITNMTRYHFDNCKISTTAVVSKL
jgi:hypothetical protein